MTVPRNSEEYFSKNTLIDCSLLTVKEYLLKYTLINSSLLTAKEFLLKNTLIDSSKITGKEFLLKNTLIDSYKLTRKEFLLKNTLIDSSLYNCEGILTYKNILINWQFQVNCEDILRQIIVKFLQRHQVLNSVLSWEYDTDFALL